MPKEKTVYDLGTIQGSVTTDRRKAEELAQKREEAEKRERERMKRFKTPTETFQWDVKAMTLGKLAGNIK